MSRPKLMRRGEQLLARLNTRAGGLAVLGATMAIAAAITFWETRGQALYADELSIFAVYRDWDLETITRSQSGHLIATTVAVYKAIWGIFGAESLVPFRIYHVALSLICAGLVYALVRPRLGPLLAVAPVLLLLFLGSGNELTATPFGSLAYISIALGLGMFLALEREDLPGDIAAAVLLALGLASYSVILAFAAGAAVMIWRRGPERRWRSAWIIAVPLLGYVVWRQFGLDSGESNVALSNFGRLPGSIAELAAAAGASLSGLFREPGGGGAFRLEWGYPVAVVLAGLVALRLRAGPPPSTRFWAYAATLAAFWVLIAINLGPLRSPDASRYQYIGVMLILLGGVELAPRIRARSWAAAGLALAFAASLLANAVALHQAAPDYRAAGNIVKATLGATEIAGPAADPEAPVFELPALPVTRDLIFPVSGYLDAVDRWGSPGYTEDQLASAFATPRETADQQLARLLGIGLDPSGQRSAGAGSPELRSVAAGSSSAASPGCFRVTPAPGAEMSAESVVPEAGLTLQAERAPALVSLKRFGDAASVDLGGVAAGASGSIAIPADLSERPWIAVVSSTRPVDLCSGA